MRFKGEMKQFFFQIALILVILCGAQTLFGQIKTGKTTKRTIAAPAQSKYACLSPDVELETVVSTRQIQTASGSKLIKETIKQRLDKLNTRCKSGKMVDGKGREIRFYRLQGCWGNPPQDYQEILDNQARELAELKKKFTVIELTCNPSGGLPF